MQSTIRRIVSTGTWIVLLVGVTYIAIMQLPRFGSISDNTSVKHIYVRNDNLTMHTSRDNITNIIHQPSSNTLQEKDRHYSKVNNNKRKKYYDDEQKKTDNNNLNSTIQVQVKKEDLDTKTGNESRQSELQLITKKLSEKYEYHGPGFGRNNFPGMKSFSESLRGTKHHDKNKRKRVEGD
eukprot:scaffold4177_cov86-Cyclotella_meneghiniana.AAC.10